MELNMLIILNHLTLNTMKINIINKICISRLDAIINEPSIKTRSGIKTNSIEIKEKAR